MDILPEGLVDSAIEWADGLGYLGLAILTFTEAALQTNSSRSFSLEYDSRGK